MTPNHAWGRREDLHVIYPQYNRWNDNPYCILNTPRTTSAHQKVAEAFRAYLMSETPQPKAMEYASG